MGSRGKSRAGHRSDDQLPTGSRPTSGPTLPGRAERRKLARKVKRRRRRSAIKEIPLLIGVALLIALVLKTFLVQAFVIPSGSMEQTIKIGDRVVVDKLTPWFGAQVHRGDVVVFKDPGNWLAQEAGDKKDPPVGVKQIKEGLTWIGLLPSDNDRDLIKRVVGVGGDTVKCCDKQGRVTVNGTPLDEKAYIHPGNAPSKFDFSVKVPEGRLFVMGDHRANSADSRYHLTDDFKGTVAEESVVGRARGIVWPIGHWTTLGEPETFSAVADAQGDGSTAASRTSHKVATTNSAVPGSNASDSDGLIPLPTPAELPLVMGVVGLHRVGIRQRHGVRSGCGGLGGRRTVRAWARGAARAIRRRGESGRDGPRARGR
ncbi:signal peptidase I [Streptomyces longispororuber]|uniref:signal peptidase I n=1 Tax=Streptomyces longispororuber TaxID=68230 RepID=UPI002109D4DC|nr:signal peptidase I [Streptomyces longispororuber]MCQ4210546.1 signal peptidase I [Streptomyces longispororuber]